MLRILMKALESTNCEISFFMQFNSLGVCFSYLVQDTSKIVQKKNNLEKAQHQLLIFFLCNLFPVSL